MIRELVIQLKNNHIFLSPQLAIPFENSNLPIEHCTFRNNSEIFWKVMLIDYSPSNKCWKVKVIDYGIDEVGNFNRQKSTRPVERIAFEKFDWAGLEPHLSSYRKIKLLEVLEKQDVDAFFSAIQEKTTWQESANTILDEYDAESRLLKADVLLKNEELAPLPIIRRYNIEFSVSYVDSRFSLGYVSFSHFVREVLDHVEFKIENEYLLPEFDLIKFWFAKKMKSKKFQVKARVITSNGRITEVLAKSDQIAMINEEFIDSIKFQRTIQLSKPPLFDSPQKALYTADELFEEVLGEDQQGNIFNQSEQDVLKHFIEQSNVRNKKQLQYLAGLKQSDAFKLRFTLNPNFGFIFFIEGDTQNHFVWELLNSHATYMWSIDKSYAEANRQFKRIEASINAIRSTGREKYKRAYKTNHIDHDLLFSVIEHDSIQSTFIDGFAKWKHRLNERLV